MTFPGLPASPTLLNAIFSCGGTFNRKCTSTSHEHFMNWGRKSAERCENFRGGWWRTRTALSGSACNAVLRHKGVIWMPSSSKLKTFLRHWNSSCLWTIWINNNLFIAITLDIAFFLIRPFFLNHPVFPPIRQRPDQSCCWLIERTKIHCTGFSACWKSITSLRAPRCRHTLTQQLIH